MECKSAYQEVCSFAVESDVDRERGGVVVGPKVGLPSRGVLHHKVHDAIGLCAGEMERL